MLSLRYSPNNQYLATGSENGTVHIFETATARLIASLPGHSMSVRALAFSPSSQTLVSASDDKRINIYDVVQRNCIATLAGHSSWVLSVDFSPDGQHFARFSLGFFLLLVGAQTGPSRYGILGRGVASTLLKSILIRSGVWPTTVYLFFRFQPYITQRMGLNWLVVVMMPP